MHGKDENAECEGVDGDMDVPLGSRRGGLRVGCIDLADTPCRAFGRRFGLRGRSRWTRFSSARISGVWPIPVSYTHLTLPTKA